MCRLLLLIFTLIFSYFQLSSTDLWERTNFPIKAKIISLDNVINGSDRSRDIEVFAVTSEGDLYISRNKGDTWEKQAISVIKITSVATSHKGITFVGSENQGIFKSSDFGRSWTFFNDGLDSSKTLILSAAKNIYSFSKTLGLIKSPVDSCNFISDNLGIEGIEVTCLYLKHPNIYIGTKNNGVYYKNKDSLSWLKYPGFPFNSQITDICFSYGSGLHLSTASEGMYYLDGKRAENDSLPSLNVNTCISCDDIIIDYWDWNYRPAIPLYSVLIGTPQGFFFQSSENDTNFYWKSLNDGLLDSNITCLAMREASVVFAGTENDGVYRTTWQGIYQKVDSYINASKLKIFPNPAQDKTFINYTLDYPANIKIGILNSLGQKIMDLNKTKRYIGEFSVELRTDEIPSGVYFVKMQIGSETYTEKIVILK